MKFAKVQLIKSKVKSQKAKIHVKSQKCGVRLAYSAEATSAAKAGWRTLKLLIFDFNVPRRTLFVFDNTLAVSSVYSMGSRYGSPPPGTPRFICPGTTPGCFCGMAEAMPALEGGVCPVPAAVPFVRDCLSSRRSIGGVLPGPDFSDPLPEGDLSRINFSEKLMRDVCPAPILS